MHGTTAFTDPENWTGGFYGLSLEIGDHEAELAGEVPEQRWNGYLLPVDGQLSYTPANH